MALSYTLMTSSVGHCKLAILVFALGRSDGKINSYGRLFYTQFVVYIIMQTESFKRWTPFEAAGSLSCDN